MEPEIIRASREVSDAGVNIIIYDCTTGSLIGGKGYDKKIRELGERD